MEVIDSSLSGWLNAIATVHPKGIDLGLARIRPIAEKMALTSWDCPVVVVAGTNGKGSVIATMSAIYREAGLEVASYTSPHLLTFNERLQINGRVASDEGLVEAFSHVDEMRSGASLTFFEWTTLGCLWLAKRSSIDVLLLEVGLGGRLDAVNVVDADLAVITAIDLDHQRFLGDTREAIAQEKAGVFRPGQIVVVGDDSPPATLLAAAQDNRVKLQQIGRSFTWCEKSDFGWCWESGDISLSGKLPLAIKSNNAASAIMAVQSLADRLPVKPDCIVRAVEQVAVPGRFDVRPFRGGELIFDVAHNPQAATYLANNLASKGAAAGKTWSIFAALKDKDLRNMILPMRSAVDAWLIAELDDPRGCSLEDMLTEFAAQSCDVVYYTSCLQVVVGYMLERWQPGDRCIVWGSFVTVGEVMKQIQGVLQ